MKKCNLKVVMSVLAASVMLASCSDDEPDAPTVYRRVIGFENAHGELAGPTSYGENLYAGYSGSQFVSGWEELESGVNLEFGINSDGSSYNYWNGGIALSQWNYRSDKDGDSDGWWYSYMNQCSVYNTVSTDGSNTKAGADGSNTFAVMTGYTDASNNSSPSFNFSGSSEYVVESMMYCPTSYLYGVITEGNPYGIYGDKSLEEAGGWFKMTATGYDAAGNVTQTVEEYVCDYRNASRSVAIGTTWKVWDLSALGRVNKIVFNFEGSDCGQWGLNTPAYMAIDNITVRMN